MLKADFFRWDHFCVCHEFQILSTDKHVVDLRCAAATGAGDAVAWLGLPEEGIDNGQVMGFGALQNAVAAFILVAKPIPPCNASYPPLADPTCPFKSPPIAMYSSGNLRFGGGHLSSSRKHPSRCQGSPSAGRGLRQLKESPCLISS